MGGEASGRFVIRMEPGLHGALREAARAAGTSLNEYCVRKLAGRGYEESGAVAEIVRRAGAIVGNELAAVVLFGSWARGAATEDSDVDVLIVADRAAITRALYRQWDASPITWDSRRVEPHFVVLPERGDRLSGLWAEVAIDGIVLFERGFEMSGLLAAMRSRIADGVMVRRWSNGHPYWVAA